MHLVTLFLVGVVLSARKANCDQWGRGEDAKPRIRINYYNRNAGKREIICAH